jgi:hypothetical protein
MTPKLKAEELWGKYFQLNYDWDGATKDQWAKEGALIAVDEIIQSCPLEPAHPYDYVIAEREAMEFWQEVKQEIEKL